MSLTIDMKLFMSNYRSDLTTKATQVVALDGGVYDESVAAAAEASLDIQYTVY
jgi:hypothetical protein